MQKTIKKQWVKALRSGKYEQAQERLLDDNGKMCCLGVLCDIAFDGEWDKEFGAWVMFPDDENLDRTDGGELPMSMLDSIGMDLNDQEKLITLNDEDGFTFAQIADYIEANL
jgi:hypothetical protein